jgi:lipopolysaccharide biosynthesis glycosyltransferase
MRDLIYYAIGYNDKYISLLDIAIKSLMMYSSTDILVICDDSFLPKCKEILPERILYMTTPDSLTTADAAMQKLKIFDYENINSYDRVLFLDSDIIVHTSLEPFFNGVRRPGILYVYTEREPQYEHKNLCFSLWNYTPEDFIMFKIHKVMVFNTGCFLFIRCPAMKFHFDEVRKMTKTHKGPFFFEQSFMNVYFNKLNATDRTVLTKLNYIMGASRDQDYKGFLAHFSHAPGHPDNKFESMKEYYSRMLLTNS